MKVCLITSMGKLPGGVGNWKKVVEKEIRKDCDIELNIIDIEAGKRSSEKTLFDSITNGSYIMLRTYVKLFFQILRNRPDIVHMTTSGGLGFYRDLLLLKFLRRKRISAVYHIHFGRTVKYKEENGRCFGQIKKAVSMAACTITIDVPTYDILKIYAHRIENINNPIDVVSISKFSEGIREENRIVFLGTIIKAKGVEELIEGFNRFHKNDSNGYELYIVGSGTDQYLSELKSKACKKIRFVGEVDHDKAMQILASAQTLILPSYTEGFPNVILEAMALRKCVVASNVGAIPQMLSDDCGIIIAPGSASEIEKALVEIDDEEKRHRIAQKGYDKVCRQYDAVITYQKYKEVWTRCISGQGGSE